jgi:hypothetical protein
MKEVGLGSDETTRGAQHDPEFDPADDIESPMGVYMIAMYILYVSADRYKTPAAAP